MSKEKKYVFNLYFVIVLIITLFVSPYAYAIPQGNFPPDTTNQRDTSQVNLIYPFNDDTGNPYIDDQNVSPLFMRDPENIKREIIYNPETNTYEFETKVGDFNYRTPTIMDFEDYQQYDLDNDVRSYWNERTQTAGTAEGSRLIPKIYVGGEAFDLSLIHISEPTRLKTRSRMPSSA